MVSALNFELIPSHTLYTHAHTHTGRIGMTFPIGAMSMSRNVFCSHIHMYFLKSILGTFLNKGLLKKRVKVFFSSNFMSWMVTTKPFLKYPTIAFHKLSKYVQTETINKHHVILFIAYIEVTFLNLCTTKNTAHGYLCY